MYLKQLVKGIRWSTAVVAYFTMSFSTLATAKEAEKISRTQIENYINQTGLNKATTWADFFEKTKSSYPEDVAKKIQEFVNLNPNKTFPIVKLKSAQGTTGSSTPVLEVYDNGKTYTIQTMGEADKWAKINGITLQESDLENPANALIRLQTGNINFKKEADAFFTKHNLLPDQNVEEMKSNFSLFKSFPRMTPQLWATMTKTQRKDFLKQIESVWRAAEEVLNSNPQSKTEKKTSLLENYIKFFLVSEALADEPPTPLPAPTPAQPQPGPPSAPVPNASAPVAPTAQQQTISRLEEFLRSNPDLLRAYQSRTWSIELDRKLVEFEVSAERQAQSAIQSCLGTSTTYMDNSQVQRTACEDFGRQLQISATVIAPLRATSCRAPARYIGSYQPNEARSAARDQKDSLNRHEINPTQEQLCSCEGTSTRVKFNEECPAAGSIASVQPTERTYSTDIPSRQNRSAKKDNIWPLVIGGAAVGVLAGLLFFKKDKKKPTATATTANSSNPARCPANQVGSPPSCSCGPCTSPQRVYNFVTCQCTNVTNAVICPNNEVAPNGDVSKCLKCSDGTYKTTEPCPSARPANCVGANCGGVRPAIQ